MLVAGCAVLLPRHQDLQPPANRLHVLLSGEVGGWVTLTLRPPIFDLLAWNLIMASTAGFKLHNTNATQHHTAQHTTNV